MAVYTLVTPAELDAFLAAYDVGAVRSFKGIAEGVENSNYLLKAERGSYILTLFEKRVAKSDLPFFLGFMDYIAARGVKSARPIPMRGGETLGTLCGRPAALIEFLDGISSDPPSVAQSRNAGAALAQLHVAGDGFSGERRNDLGPGAWPGLLDAARPRADEVQKGLAALLDGQLSETLARWPEGLPGGVIHADLFPDNVLFVGDEVSGLIDFYFACTDSFAYDLAVMINAWCFDKTGAFEAEKSAALIEGYQSLRQLTAAERAALPQLARGAALRFILTRLNDWLTHDPKALVTPKDPLALLPHLAFHAKATSSSVYGA
jgi:homoserine kinase type II